MGWLDGLTRNWAELDPDAEVHELRPVVVSLTPQEALARVAARLPELRRWAVERVDTAGGSLHATHTTRLWRFVDDVHAQFEPYAGGTRIVARSQSRVGKGDFGQNARNLKNLTRFLRAEFGGDSAGQTRK